MLQKRLREGDWTRTRRLEPDINGGFWTSVEVTTAVVRYRVVARQGDRVRRSDQVRITMLRPTEVFAGPVRTAVASGGEVRFEGVVRPARTGVEVELLRHTRRGWRVEAAGRSATYGAFLLSTDAPVVRTLRTLRYRVRLPARPRWGGSRSEWSAVDIAPTTGLAVDRTPVFFEVGPEVGASIELPVDLVAGQPVAIEASSVTPDNRVHFDMSVLDPSGQRVESSQVGDQYYGQGLQPTVSGTYAVRLTVDYEPSVVTGLVWVSTPQVVPIEVDGDPVDLTGRLRPGQPSWLTFHRAEGDLFTVGCVSPVYCDSGQQLVSVGHSPSELGPVGPTRQDMWNPPRTGAYYLEDTSRAPLQVWLTSANPEPLPVTERSRPLLFTRPGQARGVTLEVVEGRQYALSVIDRGLVDPLAENGDDAVPQRFDVAGFGSPGGGYLHEIDQRGSVLTSFRAPSDGVWTIFVDPVGPAIGPMELDIEEVAARRPAPLQ